MLINRKAFLQQIVLAGAASITIPVIPAFLYGASDYDQITILHTNDIHSQLLPFPADGSKNSGLGGAAQRAAIVQQIRGEVEHVLLFDSGDYFQGTPYFQLYKGEPEIKSMTMIGYDAALMGEHEFDAGIENFATQLKHANFPILISNYQFTGTSMDNRVLPYKVFQKGKLRIGVFGIGIDIKGLVPKELSGSTVSLPPIESANATADLLKNENCDMIICLSHLGDSYKDNTVSDEILAKQCYNIDLIIGGHTHRLFDFPRVYKNRNNGDTIVNQAGWGGTHLGRLDFFIERSGKKKSMKPHTVVIGKNYRE